MDYSKKRIFITGIAGFIGFHLAKFLKNRGDFVIGCDNFNDYYDPDLKKLRANLLYEQDISIHHLDICSAPTLHALIQEKEITHFVHLAAQAGIRYSIQNPAAYERTNLYGFFHVLEILRKSPHIPLIYASSSSVYGLNKKIPFSETDPTDQPANFYGATKKSNEMMAHAYHCLYGIQTTGLRFFTVYGPFGRPDMAYFSFTRKILDNETIRLFNYGNMQRDFTYIDDIVAGAASAIDLSAPCEIFNLGNHKPEKIETLVSLIENYLGKKAKVEKIPIQPGEIPITYANTEKAKNRLSFTPTTSLQKGMNSFLKWYTETLVSN